jgi:hypothetical protein
MVPAGISLRVVQDIGGWSTPRMLERYAHLTGAEMSRAVRVLTAYIATGTAPKIDQRVSKSPSPGKCCEVGRWWRPQRDTTGCISKGPGRVT